MNPYPHYPRHTPPPSRKNTAELVGTLEGIDVWWDPATLEYWYNLPGIADVWKEPGRAPFNPALAPAFPLAETHHHLMIP